MHEDKYLNGCILLQKKVKFRPHLGKNGHCGFLLKAPRQSVSILIYGEEIVALSLRVGKTCVHAGLAALCTLQRRPKSEEVIIPNSQAQVLNYSQLTVEKYPQM